MTARLRAWTYERMCLGSPAPSANAALRSVVAVYSAHPTAPLALGARAPRMTGEEFRALERKRDAVRIPGMRGSSFLVPRGLAPAVFAPFRLTPAALATRLRRGGMSPDDYAQASQRVVAAAATPRRPRELQTAAGVAGLEMSILLRTMRGEGHLLAVSDGGLRSGDLRYVATAHWAPDTLAGLDPQRALEELAADYLRAYGPARVADFAWWTGVSRGVARRALGTQDTVDAGDGLLLPRADVTAFNAVVARRNTLDLLPKWDAYTMGHAPDGRARLVHPDNQARVYVQRGVTAPGQPRMGLPGDGYPVVLIDGEAAGTWNVTLRGVSVELFDTVGAATRGRLDTRMAAVESLLRS